MQSLAIETQASEQGMQAESPCWLQRGGVALLSTAQLTGSRGGPHAGLDHDLHACAGAAEGWTDASTAAESGAWLISEQGPIVPGRLQLPDSPASLAAQCLSAILEWWFHQPAGSM